ncbi:MAG TPA: hypothetical protein ENG70_02225 [Candidatus Cloacimonetes bacterium]|nr:hypothetical protein [Candidatus Cloacimonadota bacterium]HEX37662.1 hypothetical protein [Candidatus Cloacimonadota bacterium]
MDVIVEISKEDAYELMDRTAKFIVERRMGSAALLFIESLRPLNFIASQILYLVAPFAEIIFKPKEYQKFACALENDENIKYLMDKIDELDAEYHKKIKAEKKKAKELKLKKKELKKKLK